MPIDWGKSSGFKIPMPKDEEQRLAALQRYDILDTPPEKSFERIVRLASHVADTPIALVVLIDMSRSDTAQGKRKAISRSKRMKRMATK